MNWVRFSQAILRWQKYLYSCQSAARWKIDRNFLSLPLGRPGVWRGLCWWVWRSQECRNSPQRISLAVLWCAQLPQGNPIQTFAASSIPWAPTAQHEIAEGNKPFAPGVILNFSPFFSHPCARAGGFSWSQEWLSPWGRWILGLWTQNCPGVMEHPREGKGFGSSPAREFQGWNCKTWEFQAGIAKLDL